MYPVKACSQNAKLLPLMATAMLALLSSAVFAGPADRFADVQMQAQHVSGSVHMLQGAGGNIGVSVGADGTMIIDDQFAPLADKITAAIGELGGDQPRLVLNTHYHGDHTGSNPHFGKAGTIIAHDNVRVRLLDQEDYPRSGLPLVTYDDTLNVHFNDDTIALIHLPTGHTDGDTVVWFKQANVVHMGDHFFKGRFPYVDIEGGGNVDGFIANVRKVIDMVPADCKIIPGHGTLSTVADLQATIDTVAASVALIRTGLADGKTPKALIKALDKQYPKYGTGFINAERWVSIVQSDTSAD